MRRPMNRWSGIDIGPACWNLLLYTPGSFNDPLKLLSILTLLILPDRCIRVSTFDLPAGERCVLYFFLPTLDAVIFIVEEVVLARARNEALDRSVVVGGKNTL